MAFTGFINKYINSKEYYKIINTVVSNEKNYCCLVYLDVSDNIIVITKYLLK